jgi:LPS export ABC transporter protein LptC
MRRARRATIALLGLAVAGAAAGACSDVQPPPVAADPSIADSAEQILFGVRHALVGAGVRRGELFSDTVYMFDQGTRLELRGVRANFFTETGTPNGTLTSREGTYSTRIARMEARGDVVVQSVDGRRLTSPELRYHINEGLIRSDSSFVLTRPGERLTGVGFTSDPDLRNVRIEQTTGGGGGTVTIPGQRQ